MGNGRASLWDGAPIAIRQILRPLESNEETRQVSARSLRARLNDDIAASRDEGAQATGKKGGTPEVNAAYLHSKLSFRSLFNEIDVNRYVTKTVVAAYLGLSSKTIEEGLKSVLSMKGSHTWRWQLANWPEQPPPPPAMREAKYRWSFVTDEMPSLLERQLERAQERREALTVGSKKSRPLPMLYLGEVIDGVQYLINEKGSVLYALGQGHVSISRFLNDCDAGAHLVKMSTIDALSKPWMDLVARQAWEEAATEALDRSYALVRASIGKGRAESERLRFMTDLPDASVRRHKGPARPI